MGEIGAPPAARATLEGAGPADPTIAPGFGEVRRDRRVDAGAALIGFGGFLFLPATLSVFAQPAHLLGAPLIWAFVFGAWLALIGAAAVVARRGGAPLE